MSALSLNKASFAAVVRNYQYQIETIAIEYRKTNDSGSQFYVPG